MATFSKGILGGFSGTVGTVIGGTWKGIEYMRSKSNRRSFNPSQAQLEQQVKFGMSVRFVQSMSGVVELGFRNQAVKKTGVNSAVSYALKHAIAGTYPAYTISYSNMLISRGEMPNAIAPSVTSAPNGVASFSWGDNSGLGSARDTDLAMLVAYCPATNQCIYNTIGAQRSSLSADLDLSILTGLVVETYIGFISDNGKNIANSIYTGSITVS